MPILMTGKASAQQKNIGITLYQLGMYLYLGLFAISTDLSVGAFGGSEHQC